MSSPGLLDLVTKYQDGYRLVHQIPKAKFAELCSVLGKHGCRYSGMGIFRKEALK